MGRPHLELAGDMQPSCIMHGCMEPIGHRGRRWSSQCCGALYTGAALGISLCCRLHLHARLHNQDRIDGQAAHALVVSTGSSPFRCICAGIREENDLILTFTTSTGFRQTEDTRDAMPAAHPRCHIVSSVITCPLLSLSPCDMNTIWQSREGFQGDHD